MKKAKRRVLSKTKIGGQSERGEGGKGEKLSTCFISTLIGTTNGSNTISILLMGAIRKRSKLINDLAGSSVVMLVTITLI